jgi:hypothetical protein
MGRRETARGHERTVRELNEERAAALVRISRVLAVTYRWYLEVQREALGLRQHHRLDEFYPIPAPIE